MTDAPADALAELKPLATPKGGFSAYTPVLHIKPGEDVTYCTVTERIADEDLFIHTTRGVQSSMGHHAIMYFSPDPMEAGTTACTGEGMEKFRQMIGGSGGEGQSGYDPPANVGIKVPKGSQFVLQSHWINTSEETVDVQAMMIAEPGPTEGGIEAGSVVVGSFGFNVPPNSSGKSQTECTFDKDHRFLMHIGHEHEWGTHVKAEVVRAAGGTEVLFDRPFAPSDVFDPPIDGFTADEPRVIKKGDTLRFSCDWQNTTSAALTFPREMCIFFGFTLEAEDDICANGSWVSR